VEGRRARPSRNRVYARAASGTCPEAPIAPALAGRAPMRAAADAPWPTTDDPSAPGNGVELAARRDTRDIPVRSTARIHQSPLRLMVGSTGGPETNRKNDTVGGNEPRPAPRVAGGLVQPDSVHW